MHLKPPDVAVFTFKDSWVNPWCWWFDRKVTLLPLMAKVPLSQSVLLAHGVFCFLAFRPFPSVFEVTLSVPIANEIAKKTGPVEMRRQRGKIWANGGKTGHSEGGHTSHRCSIHTFHSPRQKNWRHSNRWSPPQVRWVESLQRRRCSSHQGGTGWVKEEKDRGKQSRRQRFVSSQEHHVRPVQLQLHKWWRCEEHGRSKDELLPYNLVCSLQSTETQKRRERKSDHFFRLTQQFKSTINKYHVVSMGAAVAHFNAAFVLKKKPVSSQLTDDCNQWNTIRVFFKRCFFYYTRRS